MIRSLADRQLRALAAAAYRGDSASRSRQRQAAKLLRASLHAEKRYERDVTRAMRGVHEGIHAAALEEVERRGRGVAGGAEHRHDAARTFPPRGMEARLFAYVRKHVATAFDRMAKTVDDDNREGLALFGVSPAHVPGLAGHIASAREEAIRRVQDGAKRYTDDVLEVLDDPELADATVDELAKHLAERADVSDSYARFIARDTTLRTNAAVSRMRQRAVGVSRYRWSTSRDERVRERHAELEGEAFDYDDPPETTDAGETNNPGEDWQCRCVALPVIEEFEEEGTPDEEPEAAE